MSESFISQIKSGSNIEGNEILCYSTNSIPSGSFVSPVLNSGFPTTKGCSLTSIPSLSNSNYNYSAQVSRDKIVVFSCSSTSSSTYDIYVATCTLNSFNIVTGLTLGNALASNVASGSAGNYRKVFRLTNHKFIMFSTSSTGVSLRLITFNEDYTSVTLGSLFTHTVSNNFNRHTCMCQLTENRLVFCSTNNASGSSYDFWNFLVVNMTNDGQFSVYSSNCYVNGDDNHSAAENLSICRATDTSFWVTCSGYGNLLITIDQVSSFSERELEKGTFYKSSNVYTFTVEVDGELYGIYVDNGTNSIFKVYKITSDAITLLYTYRGGNVGGKYFCMVDVDSDKIMWFDSSTSELGKIHFTSLRDFISGNFYLLDVVVQLYSTIDFYTGYYSANALTNNNIYSARIFGVVHEGGMYYLAGGYSNSSIQAFSFSLIPNVELSTGNTLMCLGVAEKELSSNSDGYVLSPVNM